MFQKISRFLFIDVSICVLCSCEKIYSLYIYKHKCVCVCIHIKQENRVVGSGAEYLLLKVCFSIIRKQ